MLTVIKHKNSIGMIKALDKCIYETIVDSFYILLYDYFPNNMNKNYFLMTVVSPQLR